MDKRRSYRFDKVFPVAVSSRVFGEASGIARNISEGGMFVEMSEPLPLGCVVRIHFAMPDSDGEIVARGEVKRHYFLNFADGEGQRQMTGIGVRFTRFEAGEHQYGENLGRLALRTLH